MFSAVKEQPIKKKYSACRRRRRKRHKFHLSLNFFFFFPLGLFPSRHTLAALQSSYPPISPTSFKKEGEGKERPESVKCRIKKHK